MGVPGPGGPCSEIYYDRGPEFGKDGGPVVDEDRYLEIWNLVFMQDERGELSPKEDYPPIGELPAKNIDTGMGIERVAFLLQDVDNVYETDLVRPVITKAEEMSGRRYGADPVDDVRFRVIADHARSGVMLIGDGVHPRQRGARLRAAPAAAPHRPLGAPARRQRAGAAGVRRGRPRHDGPGLPGAGRPVRPHRSPWCATRRTRSSRRSPAARRSSTWRRARPSRRAARVLAGDKAFQLHDTYGFPIDLTLEMASEQGLTVDEDGFRRLMAEQRQRSKEDAASRKVGHGDGGAYRVGARQARRDRLPRLPRADHRGHGRRAARATASRPSRCGAGAEVEVVLDRTPFYAEGGGQLADTGRIVGDGFEVEVHDVQSPVAGLNVHRGKVVSGEVTARRRRCTPRSTRRRRRAVSRSHSATHLVHAGVRRALGTQAAQAGSLNAPGRLRFDFTSPGGAVPASVLADVEDEVNDVLLNDYEVRAEHHHAGRGARVRRDRALRREVRRQGPRGRRSATTRGSCAAARTCTAPARSAW